MKLTVLLFTLIFTQSMVGAQGLDITQVDATRLLSRQEVRLYLSLSEVIARESKGLSSDQIKVFESSDQGQTFTQVPVLNMSAQATKDDGIQFFLLVDNSGSMYEEEEWRIRQVREAISSFLLSVDSPRDAFALAEFNSLYKVHTSPTYDLPRVQDLLNQISKPARADGYTELYEGLLQELEGLKEVPGRKVVIVLSDGEQFPYSKGENKPHPVYGDRVSEPTDVIEALGRSGVTLFAIRFGDEKDKSLESLTRAGGGKVYDASNMQEISGIYKDIRQRVLEEYRLTYLATMNPGDKRIVKVELDLGNEKREGRREYFAGTLFGIPSSPAFWLPWVLFILAFILWFLLTQLKFLNTVKSASLEVISGGSSRPMLLTDQRTVIGSSSSDHMTISGAPQLKESHATIVFDEEKKFYTVMSAVPIRVNNRKVQKGRRLNAGDVIQVGGATIVFDGGEEIKDPKI